MRGLWKFLSLTAIFGVVYVFTEVFFRSVRGEVYMLNNVPYTHISMIGWTSLWMMVVGGLCGSIVGLLDEFSNKKDRYKNPGYLIKTLLGMSLIFCTEFLSGLLFNIHLHMNLWTYNDRFNIMHQITLIYAPLWFALSVLAQWLDDVFRHYMDGSEWPGSITEAFSRLFRF